MATNETTPFVQTVLKSWDVQVSRINDLVNQLTDEDLAKDIAPGKNSGQYVLGHIAAVNDGIFPLLGAGEKLYPQLGKLFIATPDKSGQIFPSISDVRRYWFEINQKLRVKFDDVSAESWLEKHTAVSEEDYTKEPFRNKINIVMNRTIHMGYHHGQLVWLRVKE